MREPARIRPSTSRTGRAGRSLAVVLPVVLPAVLLAGLFGAPLRVDAAVAAEAASDGAHHRFGPQPSAEQRTELKRWRAERRSALRAAVTAKAGGTAPFALLVVPVDFADERLPAGWDPAASLAPYLLPPQGETLAGYFARASLDRLDLRVTVAPLIRLEGTRLDYSDRDLGGVGLPRSRALATAALEGARDRGIDFRSLDADGPDGIAGTTDDDGEVDGVLILHAAIGIENDFDEGLIMALQHFLDEPVVDRGIAARHYAVASLRSGLGIWTHETAHLFGLEDRYDLYLPPVPGPGGGDFAGAGGLGRFSLMAAGAWGTGGGSGAALPDAYSRFQLGWADVVEWDGAVAPETLIPVNDGGVVWRVWTRNRSGPEFFLLETRGGGGAGPFDADIPAGQLLIYHVDETLAEGEASSDTFPDRHLRVRLVEADGDDALARGENLGGLSDLFPGSLGVSAFGPATDPASDGYEGPTEVDLANITSLPGGVALTGGVANGYGVTMALAFTTEPGPRLIELAVRADGWPLDFPVVTATVTATSDPPHGAFPAAALEVTLTLAEEPGGAWRPIAPVAWTPDPDLPAGAATDFSVVVRGSGDGAWTAPAHGFMWLWNDPADPLDFTGDWPGGWLLEHPAGAGTTTWHRWLAPAMTDDGRPVLACTGAAYTDGQDWPQVAYANRAEAQLTSSPLGPNARAVRFLHAVDAEELTPGLGIDGGSLEWVGPAGSRPALPIGGFPERLTDGARHALHGLGGFSGQEPLDGQSRPVWRVDLIPLPAESGPWRLRLRFASDTVWRGRGWTVAEMRVLGDAAPAEPFAVEADAGAGRLRWTWPWEEPSAFRVERRPDDTTPWSAVWQGPPPASDGDHAHGITLAEVLPPGGGDRWQVRVVALIPVGDVASRSVICYPGGGPEPAPVLGHPYPNPGRQEMRIAVSVPAGARIDLSLLDVRGRRVRRWDLPGGDLVVTWDGRDDNGRGVAAGVYLFRLDGPGGPQTRKAVWLR